MTHPNYEILKQRIIELEKENNSLRIVIDQLNTINDGLLNKNECNNAVSVPSSPRNFGQNFPDFVDATYKFLLNGGHTTSDRKIKIETLDTVLGHLKPNDTEFEIFKCLKSFPSKFQIDELSDSVYTFPRDDVLLPAETPSPKRSLRPTSSLGPTRSPSPIRSLTPVNYCSLCCAEYGWSPSNDDNSFVTITKI
jgi:hypothetical protein